MADQDILFYGASQCLYALAPMAHEVDLGVLGLERVLYHAISRGADLKRVRNIRHDQ